MAEVSYKGLLSLNEEKLIAGAFKLLWRSLQRSEVSKFFDSREFAMFSIEKNEKKSDKYFKLLKEIIQYFASIEIASYDSNAGYTYFKKDLNKGTAKTFGQFYTPPSVLCSVVKEVNPKAGEKTLDPSSGSCSFIQEAATKLMKKDGLSVEEAFKNLYGVEIEPNIYQEGAMNIFLNFGIIPNTEENIREDDSLIVLLQEEQKFDKILANPPFGADASSFFGMYFKDETVKKGKRVVTTKVVNPDVKVHIPFTNMKESAILFFQLIVQKLVDGGKAGVVMSYTLLNDGNKDMMKWFLECCSLEKVIINPAGTFKDQGTGIETFSFIFTKGAPTTKVDIVMLGAEDDVVRSLTIDQIKETGWKLQLKEEEKKVEYTGQYELKKFGEICSFVNGHAFKSEDFIETGIPVVKITNIKSGGLSFEKVQYSKEDDTLTKWIVKPNDIVISLTGYPGDIGLNLTNVNWYLNQRVARIDITNTTIVNLMYMYYYMKYSGFRDSVKNISSGSAQPNVSTRNIEELEFPLPPLPIQQEIVSNLDRIFSDPQDMKDCLAFTDKAMDLMLKDPSGKALEDVMGGLRLKRSQLATATSIKAQMAAVMRSVGARGYEKKAIGDIVEIEGGDYITKKDEAVGEYPVYGGGTASYHINRFNREPTCVINKDGMSQSCVQIVSTRFFLNHHGWTLKLRSTEVLEKFLHWQLYFRASDIYSLATGSCQKGLNQKEFVQMIVYIPPLPIQQEVLTTLNEMEAEMNTLEQMAAKAEQRAKYILDGYLTS
jgi:type I restriction enzyme S subunit